MGCSGIGGILQKVQRLIGFYNQGIVGLFQPFSQHTAHGLGWEILPGYSWLLLRHHLCGTAAGGKEREAGEEVLPTVDSSCGTALTVGLHEGSGLRQERWIPWTALEKQLLLKLEK